MEFASASGSTPTPVKSLKKLKRDQRGIDRSAAALKRLKVSAQQLLATPQITPLLKRADGGLAQVLMAMRFCPDPIIAAFLKKYDAVPVGDRDHVPLEAVALAAEIDVSHLLGSILVSLQAQAVNTVKIIAMTSHPKITEARVAYGLLPLGERDRAALDTAMGFLPSPKGPTFIGKAIFGSGKNVMDQQRGDGDDEDEPETNGDIDMDKLFPPANLMQQKLSAIRQRMLTSSSTSGSTKVQ